VGTLPFKIFKWFNSLKTFLGTRLFEYIFITFSAIFKDPKCARTLELKVENNERCWRKGISCRPWDHTSYLYRVIDRNAYYCPHKSRHYYWYNPIEKLLSHLPSAPCIQQQAYCRFQCLTYIVTRSHRRRKPIRPCKRPWPAYFFVCMTSYFVGTNR